MIRLLTAALIAALPFAAQAYEPKRDLILPGEIAEEIGTALTINRATPEVGHSNEWPLFHGAKVGSDNEVANHSSASHEVAVQAPQSERAGWVLIGTRGVIDHARSGEQTTTSGSQSCSCACDCSTGKPWPSIAIGNHVSPASNIGKEAR